MLLWKKVVWENSLDKVKYDITSKGPIACCF